MKHLYSLAYLTLPGTHPVDQIEIAKACGYDGVSLRTISQQLPGEPDYHLADTELKGQVQRALQRTGMSCFDIELGRIEDSIDVRDYEPELAVAKELGARYVISSFWTKNRSLALERERELCDLVALYELKVNLEFMPFSNLVDLQDTVEVIRAINRPNLYLMVDILHIHHAKNTPEDLLSIPKEIFGFVHLCDGPGEISSDDSKMRDIARGGRLYMGEGEIDCASYLSKIPQVPYYSIELPNLKNIERYGKFGHAKRCLVTAQKICEGI